MLNFLISHLIILSSLWLNLPSPFPYPFLHSTLVTDETEKFYRTDTKKTKRTLRFHLCRTFNFSKRVLSPSLPMSSQEKKLGNTKLFFIRLKARKGFLKISWNKLQIVMKFFRNKNFSNKFTAFFSIHSLFLWLHSQRYDKYYKLTVKAFHEKCNLITSSLSSPCSQLRKSLLFRTPLN